MTAKVVPASASPQALAEGWDFKMCKKIAQLTKVVYTLNCRNEDNEERTKWLVQCHENEMQRMQQECAKQIGAAADKIKQAETNKIQAVRTMEANYQTSLNEAREAFAEKLQWITAAAEAAKENYERRLKKVQEETSIAQQEELGKLRDAKDFEVAGLVKEYNERYKSMLAEQMDIRDALEKQLRAEWELKVKTIQQELDSAKSASDAQLGAKSKQLLSEMGKASTLERELSGAKERLSHQEARQRELESANKELERQLSRIGETLDMAKGSEESLQKQLELMTKEKSEVTQELEKAQQSLKETQGRAEKLSSDCVNVKNHLGVAMAQKATAEGDLRELRKQYEELRSMTDELEKQRALLSSSMQDKKSGIAQLESALEEAKKEMESLKSQNAETMRALSKSHEEALRRAEQCSKESAASVLERCQKEMEEMKLGFRKQLQESEAAQQSRAALLEQQSDQRYASLQNRLAEVQKEKDALQVQQSTLQQERDAMQAKYNDLEVEYHRHQDKASEQQRKDDAEITRLREEVASLTMQGANDLDDVRRALREQEAQFGVEKEALIRRFNEEKCQIEENTDRLLHEAEERRRKDVEALKKLQEAAEQRFASSSQESARELQKLRMEAHQALEHAKTEAGNLQGRLSERLKNLESELDHLRAVGEQDKSNSQEQVRQLQGTLDGLYAAAQQREGEHAAALKKMQEAADLARAAELARERQTHATALQKMREDLANAAAEHARRVEQLERAAAERMEREDQAWRARLEAVEVDSEKQLRALEARHTAELNDQLEELRSTKDGVISGYARELSDATEMLKSTTHEVELLHRQLQAVKNDLSDATAQIQRERSEAADTLAQMREEHLEAMQRVEDEHNAQLNLLVCEHKRLSDKALLEFESERRAHEMLVAQMNESYEELQHKYNYRESRPEDVNLINQLTMSNHEKDKALKKAHHDLQVYKLELINREENYNKLFGRKPVVAADTTTQRTATSLPSIRQAQRGTSK
ncbi:unnamed protein product [Phytomonas sp. EM1]|nr:unnamed protein product [Phytomonas sp. EM1]|eukprot:CCW64388.1 unnamed protein product [Phytomonas sp. isolate EM1]